jgi:hypothetical protein
MSDTPKWSTAGANILAGEQLAVVRNHLENVGFVAVLWWHYYGSRAPTPLTFDDFEEFLAFLKTEPVKGDAIDVWPFPSDPNDRIAEGKIPNELGEVPEGGAY